jgi:hypothetical protein
MLNTIVVVLEHFAGIERRIYVDALDPTRELLLQRLERQQVVPEDEAVVEAVVRPNPLGSVIRLFGVLEQDARLQARPVLLSDPRNVSMKMRQIRFAFSDSPV